MMQLGSNRRDIATFPREVSSAERVGRSEHSPAIAKGPAVSSDSIIGSLLGTAAGDSIALPFEGLTSDRCVKLIRGELRQRLIFGRGMISDDTEHTAILGQAIIASSDVKGFKKAFAGRLRSWVAALPAGIGFATLRASLKLCCGVSPDKSGVYSAGNGPCMRSPILGVLYGDDLHTLAAYVEASSRITHTDVRAFSGAMTVAVAAHLASKKREISGEEFLTAVHPALTLTGDKEIYPLLEKTVASLSKGESTKEFANSLGLEKAVSGFVLHTVPVVIHAWLSAQTDFRKAIESTLRCGGDTDTTSAIVGGIVGARVGEKGIPAEWLSCIWEPTYGPSFLRELGSALERRVNRGIIGKPPKVPLAVRLGRNAVFMGIVLGHEVARLAKGYWLRLNLSNK